MNGPQAVQLSTTFSRRDLLRTVAATLLARRAWSGQKTEFRVFDALLHVGKPDLTTRGLTPLPNVANVWRSNVPKSMVDTVAIESALKMLPHDAGYFFFDIEEWKFLRTTISERRKSIERLAAVADIARRVRPAVKFGFYDVPPANTYWPLVASQFRSELAEWQTANVELRTIADMVDVLYPSLYTFYADHRGWLRHAELLLQAARIYKKPVYPFVWFEYHDSNQDLRDLPIDAKSWRMQLQFCKENADGVVLWGGYRRFWNESADWWQIAREELMLS